MIKSVLALAAANCFPLKNVSLCCRVLILVSVMPENIQQADGFSEPPVTTCGQDLSVRRQQKWLASA